MSSFPAPGSLSLNRKALFLSACAARPVPRVPVWIMRQAGRYLPEYRAIRARHKFLEICKTPELAIEVSLQPFRILGVDAVIVFSDILISAEAMGMQLELTEAGPVLGNPIRTAADVQALRSFDPEADTRFLLDTIRGLCRELGPEVPVLGFAGAPWTLACYMVEGQTKSGFDSLKKLMHSDPALLHLLLERIARATAPYLRAQIAAGATAVQIFDTWAGELRRKDYEEFALPATQLLISEVKGSSAPVIYYVKNSAHLMESLGKLGADVLSVDWRVELAAVRQVLGPHVVLQGNVDPCVLLGPEAGVRKAVRETVAQTEGRGHILNLGHGILPDVPVENARAFVEAGQAISLAHEETVAGFRQES
jgi:uroporphyrinogen decarboxylase